MEKLLTSAEESITPLRGARKDKEEIQNFPIQRGFSRRESGGGRISWEISKTSKVLVTSLFDIFLGLLAQYWPRITTNPFFFFFFFHIPNFSNLLR